MGQDAAKEEYSELPASRRERIVEFVNANGQVTLGEIAEHFPVSVDTIRRDLGTLHQRGLVTKTRGGAMANTSMHRPDREIRFREQLQSKEKRLIAQLVVDQIGDDAVVALNGGSTTSAVAQAFDKHRNLTIATVNLSIPGIIPTSAVKSLYIFGGEVRFSSQVTTGYTTFPESHNEGLVHFDFAVLGVGGVNHDGFTVSNLAEAATMRHMARCASTVIVVADSTKIGRKQFSLAGPISMADVFVSDVPLPAELQRAFDAAGTRCLYPTGRTS
ncbi:MAG: DeoR/GlpR family DNA-binding transcription regulator [Propionicimonas sp.]